VTLTAQGRPHREKLQRSWGRKAKSVTATLCSPHVVGVGKKKTRHRSLKVPGKNPPGKNPTLQARNNHGKGKRGSSCRYDCHVAARLRNESEPVH